jgi:hypothetical protein
VGCIAAAELGQSLQSPEPPRAKLRMRLLDSANAFCSVNRVWIASGTMVQVKLKRDLLSAIIEVRRA